MYIYAVTKFGELHVVQMAEKVERAAVAAIKKKSAKGRHFFISENIFMF